MKKSSLNQLGFSMFELSLVVLFLAVIGFVGYYVFSSNTSKPVSAQSPIALVNRWGTYIGSGAGYPETVPSGVAGLTNIVSVEASNSSDYALQCVGGQTLCATDGVVYAWGDNGSGQLGDGLNTASLTPVKVKIPVPAGVGIVSLGEAKNEGFAIDATGQAYGWGANGSGSMCTGNSTGHLTPIKLPAIKNATAVQGGQDHVLYLLASGTVVGCGDNTKGQLGIGNRQGSSTPVTVVGLTHIVQISAGNLSSGAIDSSGNVYTWGDNNNGQAGIGTIGGIVKYATKVNLAAPATQLSVGGDVPSDGQDVVLLSNGQVYSWGDNTYGQLGIGTTANHGSPVLVHVPAGATPTQVATGGVVTYVLDSSGNLWGWGKYSVVGSGYKTTYLTPLKIDTNVTLISSTADSSVDRH